MQVRAITVYSPFHMARTEGGSGSPELTVPGVTGPAADQPLRHGVFGYGPGAEPSQPEIPARFEIKG